MFILRFVQYAHLLPTLAIPYKRDGKAIVLLYSDKTNQLLRKRNLSFANIVFAAVLLPFFWGKRPEIFEKQQVFQTCFSKKCRKKTHTYRLFADISFSFGVLNKLLFANWFATQFYHKPNNISSGICLFFEKYKNKSRINHCGLILPDKLIYLFLKTASFIILANSS